METCDLWDIRSEDETVFEEKKFNFDNMTIFDNFDNFYQFWQLEKIIEKNYQFSQFFLTVWIFLTIFDNLGNFWQFVFLNFWQFWKFLLFVTILTIFDNFLTILTFSDNIDNFRQSLLFLTTSTLFDILDQNDKDNPSDLWHLRHWWITITTIENLNSWQPLLPDN